MESNIQTLRLEAQRVTDQYEVTFAGVGTAMIVLEPIQLNPSIDMGRTISSLVASKIQHFDVRVDVKWTEFDRSGARDALLNVLSKGLPDGTAPLEGRPQSEIEAFVDAALGLFGDDARSFSNWDPVPGVRADITDISPMFPNEISDVGIVVISPDMFLFIGDVRCRDFV